MASKTTLIDKKTDGQPGSSVTTSVFNLTKNILGAGVLSMPYAVAVGTGLVPGMFFAVLLGVLSAYTFSLIGLVCYGTNTTTFKGAGTKAKSAAFGTFLDVVCTAKTFFSALAFSIIIMTTFPHILESFGIHARPSVVLISITVVALLPLCLLRDLSALKPFSILGTLGTLYTLVFMIIRLVDRSYFEGGFYYNELVKANQPLPLFNHGINFYGYNAKTAILLATLSTAFIAHYNAPRFYDELENRSPARFNKVVSLAFAAAMCIVCGFMVVGYLTFGEASNGMILQNYAVTDPLATLARAAIGLSIICSYPLAFSGLRDGAMSLGNMHPSYREPLTIGLLVIVTSIALSGVQIGFVQSLGGAIFGALLIYILPGYMCICSMGGERSGGGHVLFSKAVLLPAGVALGILGTLVTIFKSRLS